MVWDIQTFLKNNDITLKYISDGYLLGPMIMLQCILDDVKIKNRYYATYIHKNNFQQNGMELGNYPHLHFLHNFL